MTKFRIHLTQPERETLLNRVKKGSQKAKAIQIAHVLLNSDECVERKSETFISQNFQVSVRVVERIRKQFCEEGMGIFDKRTRKTRSDKKIDARVEAHLTALMCQSPPDNKPKWELRMLADKLMELKVVEHISTTMVGKLLKKTSLSPSKKSNG